MTVQDWRRKTWSVDEMLAERPCNPYTRECLKEFWAGRERLGLRGIIDLDIPDADKVWVITRQYIPDWLERVVERAVRRHALGSGVPAVERWARDWLSGADRSARAAEAAMWAACAARAGTWAGTWAVWAAAVKAAWVEEAAEWRAQVEDMRALLAEEGA